MALDFIACEIIERGKTIRIPEGMKAYALNGNKIEFSSDSRRGKEIPEGVISICFPEYSEVNGISYGFVRFGRG